MFESVRLQADIASPDNYELRIMNNELNKPIVVIGSSNTDMVIRVKHLPAPGETIMGHDFMTNQGGKGANQAVAVSRLGGQAAFVARVGDDGFGRQTIQLLREEGIVNTDAFIPLTGIDEENILLSLYIEVARPMIARAGTVLMQLETPIPTLVRAARIAHEAGACVVLNPAPFPPEPLPAELLQCLDLITPNETEASMMSGVQVKDEATALEAIRAIQAQGVQRVILTAGSKGAYTEEGGQLICIPSFKVTAVDTTAAGDTFNGALCVALSEGQLLSDAIRFANKAASISVTRMGAWRSIPRRVELS